MMEYLLHLLTMVAVYAILAVSLELLVGQAGLLSVSHAAFYGIGAYSSAWISLQYGPPFPVSMAAGMGIAVIGSLLVSLPSLRLKGEYFIMATFGCQMIAMSLFNNLTSLTGGPMGIAGIPPASIFGFGLQGSRFFPVVCVVLGVIFVVVRNVVKSPLGRLLRAVREDEILAQALGKNVVRARVEVFALSAALAAAAGSLYASYTSYIDPTSFSLMESISMISAVLIGGVGNVWGSVAGAAGLVLIPEFLRFLGLPPSVAANVRQIIYGGFLIAIVATRPRGMLGSRRSGVVT